MSAGQRYPRFVLAKGVDEQLFMQRALDYHKLNVFATPARLSKHSEDKLDDFRPILPGGRLKAHD